MNRLGVAVALIGEYLRCAGASAQKSDPDYPSRLVKIIVPFGAGGPADVTARLIGKALEERFKQPFVIENRTGAGGVIGTLEVREGAGGRLYAADDVEHADRQRDPAAGTGVTN